MFKRKQTSDTFPAYNPRLLWSGRFLENNAGHRALIGSAAALKFRCYADTASVWMQNISQHGDPNYLTIIVDGVRQPRMAITSDTFAPVNIPFATSAEYHDVEIYKETEPFCGQILISSVDISRQKGELGMGDFPFQQGKRIEFIGNSIMGGMGADPSQKPCGSGSWCDQHNAYDAFGPQVARALNCHYMVTAASGRGMYRNWNNDGPVMQDFYESVELSADTTTERYVYGSFPSDLIVVCVGANDFDEGDGPTPRAPFDSTKFINAYLSFMQMIHAHQPQAKWLLLNGPVNTPANDAVFRACLDAIKAQAPSMMKGIIVDTYFFELLTPKGCGGHPDVGQHGELAKQLEGKVKEML
jgi:hypothetical protein